MCTWESTCLEETAMVVEDTTRTRYSSRRLHFILIFDVHVLISHLKTYIYSVWCLVSLVVSVPIKTCIYCFSPKYRGVKYKELVG